MRWLLLHHGFDAWKARGGEPRRTPLLSLAQNYEWPKRMHYGLETENDMKEVLSDVLLAMRESMQSVLINCCTPNSIQLFSSTAVRAQIQFAVKDLVWSL